MQGLNLYQLLAFVLISSTIGSMMDESDSLPPNLFLLFNSTLLPSPLSLSPSTSLAVISQLCRLLEIDARTTLNILTTLLNFLSTPRSSPPTSPEMLACIGLTCKAHHGDANEWKCRDLINLIQADPAIASTLNLHVPCFTVEGNPPIADISHPDFWALKVRAGGAKRRLRRKRE